MSKSSTTVVLKTYFNETESIDVAFTSDGFFNATMAAVPFGKRPVDWLALTSTQEYIEALCEAIRSEKSSLLNVVRNGRSKMDATWMHPKLAIAFARWLDVRFAVWCDLEIESLLFGSDPTQHVHQLRANAQHRKIEIQEAEFLRKTIEWLRKGPEDDLTVFYRRHVERVLGVALPMPQQRHLSLVRTHDQQQEAQS